MGTDIRCGKGTRQITFAHPQNLQTKPLSLSLQFVDILCFLFYLF